MQKWQASKTGEPWKDLTTWRCGVFSQRLEGGSLLKQELARTGTGNQIQVGGAGCACGWEWVPPSRTLWAGGMFLFQGCPLQRTRCSQRNSDILAADRVSSQPLQILFPVDIPGFGDNNTVPVIPNSQIKILRESVGMDICCLHLHGLGCLFYVKFTGRYTYICTTGLFWRRNG